MRKISIYLSAIFLVSTFSAAAQKQTLAANSSPRAASTSRSSATSPPAVSRESAAMRIDGEKRFETNCGRCHMAPQKFPPRMMATIVRHMRVRATITDEDMRAILFYMSQ
jgi:cytochrome c5